MPRTAPHSVGGMTPNEKNGGPQVCVPLLSHCMVPRGPTERSSSHQSALGTDSGARSEGLSIKPTKIKSGRRTINIFYVLTGKKEPFLSLGTDFQQGRAQNRRDEHEGRSEHAQAADWRPWVNRWP